MESLLIGNGHDSPEPIANASWYDAQHLVPFQWMVIFSPHGSDFCEVALHSGIVHGRISTTNAE